ncbi:MAG TPA: hypothetical protein VFS09_11945 [Candidatus Eisenbacteria bacterium]|nr:hypothetical protein [Candidatus Eisenbacteria bacterium]
MPMNDPSPTLRIEPRWPVTLTVLFVLLLLELLPARVRLLPRWAPYFIGLLVLAPAVGVSLTRAAAGWRRVERLGTYLFVLATGTATLAVLGSLIGAMVRRSGEVGGLQLLTSSIAVWVCNVALFAILYWQIDRGGPEPRANRAPVRPDWQFPQATAPDDAPPGWLPTFVDYLFLAFTTAAAFSPTDALPMTARAKLLMMLQGSISLVTIVVVASRAINILGN